MGRLLTPEELAKLPPGYIDSLRAPRPTPIVPKITPQIPQQSASQGVDLSIALGGAESSKIRAMSSAYEKYLSIGFTPEEARRRAEEETKAEPVVAGFTPTVPYSYIPIAPPEGEDTLVGALKPRSVSIGGELVSALAPGASASISERAEVAKKAEEERSKLRERLRKEGRGAALEALPKSGFGLPAELASQPLSEQEIEKIVMQRFPKGQEVAQFAENPIMWGLRVLTAGENIVAGTLGYGLKKAAQAVTGQDVQAMAAQSRAGERKGLAGNIITNVETGGGFTREFGEIAQYTPGLEGYTTVATGLGFLADILTPSPLKLLGPVGVGAEAATAVKAAEKAVGATGVVAPTAKAITAGVKEAAKSLPRTLADEVPLIGEVLKKRLPKGLEPTDYRVVSGQRLAPSVAAAEDYRTAYDKALGAVKAETPGIADADAVVKAHSEALNVTKTKHGAANQFVDTATKKGPDIRLDLNEDIFKIGDDVLESNKPIREAIRKIQDGQTLSKGDINAVREALTISARLDPTIGNIVKDVMKTGRPSVSAIVSRIYRDDATRTQVADILNKRVSLDESIAAIDRAISNNVFPNLLGGTKYVYATPKTLVTERGREFINERFLDSPLSKNVIQGSKVTRKPGVGDVVQIDAGRTPVRIAVRDAAARAKLKGDISETQYESIINNGRSGFIKADDLRRLANSEKDDIAEMTVTGVTRRALSPAPVQDVAREIVGETEVMRVARDRRAEELTGNFNVAIKRIQKSQVESGKKLQNLVTDTQKPALMSAKNAISNLDEIARDEIRTILSNPAERRLYDIPENPTQQQLEFGIGRGKRFASDTMNQQKANAHAEALIDAMVFKDKTTSSIEKVFSPKYEFGSSVLKGIPGSSSAQRYQKIVDFIASTPPAGIEAARPSIIAQVKELAQDAAQRTGEVFTVNEEAFSTSLTAAYAKTKSDSIVAQTVADVTREIPGVLDDTTGAFRQALGMSKEEISDFTYDIIEQEINALIDGTKGPLTLFREATTPEQRIAALNGKNTLRDLSKKKQVQSRVVDGEVVEGVPTEQIESLLADNMNRYGLMSAIEDTMTRVAQSDKVEVFSKAQFANTIDSIKILRQGGIDIDRAGVAAPLLKEYMRLIGGGANMDKLLTEVALLNEMIDKGGNFAISAASTSRKLRQLFSLYNNTFYNLILSINPKFHAQNIVSAPFIIPFTTGRALGLNPMRWKDAAAIATTGPAAKLFGNPDETIRAIDSSGIGYTSSDIYNRTLGSGVFRSQQKAEVGSNFLSDTDAFIRAATKQYGSVRRALGAVTDTLLSPSQKFLGTPFATYTDNVFRIYTVLDAVDSGKSMDEALDIGRRSLYDYGDISDIERKYVARSGFIFYNFWRQSVGTFMENLFNNPTRVIKQLRATSAATKAFIGEQQQDELSFYFPQELSSRVILKLTQSFEKDKSSILTGPDMPYKDGLLAIAMTVTDPLSPVLGPKIAGKEGERDVDQSLVVSKLGPVSKAVLNAMTGEKWYETKMSPGVIPPEHMAFYQSIGADDWMSDIFGIRKVIPKEPGKRSLEGIQYETDLKDWARYEMFMKSLESIGGLRPFNEWTKLLLTYGITGEGEPLPVEGKGSAQTALSTLGLIKEQRVPSSTETVIRRLQDVARQQKQIQREAKKQSEKQYVVEEEEE